MTAQRWLEMLAQFCATTGRACYGAFSPETLRDYLLFHIEQNTLAWVRAAAPEPERAEAHIVGCGVAWQCHAEDVIRAAMDARPFFNWQAHDPTGNALFIADVVATTPYGALALLHRFNQRFPDWPTRHLYTFRRGKLIMLTPHQVIRFFQRQHFNQKD